MTIKEMVEVLASIEFRDWDFELLGMDGMSPHLRVGFWAEDNWMPPTRIRHRGRKWAISRYMTKSELVQTALLAVLQVQEHEAREQFLYKGKAVFGPHFDVDALAAIADQVDIRKEA